MLNETDIAHLIRALAEAKGWKATYAARRATGSGDTLDRLDGGLGMTLTRASNIIKNISQLWPSDLPWPEDIPRPGTKKMADPAPTNPRNHVSEVSR